MTSFATPGRRGFVGLGAGLIGAGILPKRRAVAQSTTTLRLWTFLDPTKTSDREAVLKRLMDEFEQANPGVRVQVDTLQFAQLPLKFFLASRTGNAPDIAMVDAKNLGGLAATGAAADLNPLILNRWSDADRADFFVKAGWDAANRNGKQLAVPLFHGASVIFYRKDLFAKAGIDPASVTSWDALATTAQRLTSVKGGKDDVWGFGMPLAPNKTESTPTLIGMLDQPMSPFNACHASYAGPAGVRALQYTADLITKYHVSPQDSLVSDTDDMTDQFTAGRFAMGVGSILRTFLVQSHAAYGALNVGILPWPSWSGDHMGRMPVSGWYATAWSKSPHLELAAKFIDLMASQHAVRLWSEVGGQVPTRKSVLVDTFFRQPINQWMMTMIDCWSAASWMEPTECNTRTMQAALNEAVGRVVIDHADPVAALKEAEQKFDRSQQ
jgi:multiple sugar transport system substrate-binding protein